MAQLLHFDDEDGEFIVLADSHADKDDAFYLEEYGSVPTHKLEIVAGILIADWPCDRALAAE